MDKRFLGILTGLIVIFAVIFALSQHSSNSGSGGNKSSGQPTSHIQGKGTTGVKLIEYGDYECPVCYEYNQPVDQVVAHFGDQITYQFRNLPLSTIHPNAFAAARAAEAAGLQGKFWQMHNTLYTNQDPSGATGWVADHGDVLNDFFVKFAKTAGVSDLAKFKSDYASDQINSSINADINLFNQTGQQLATPSFFLDGKYVPNSELVDSNGVSVTKFENVINAEITKKQAQH